MLVHMWRFTKTTCYVAVDHVTGHRRESNLSKWPMKEIKTKWKGKWHTKQAALRQQTWMSVTKVWQSQTQTKTKWKSQDTASHCLEQLRICWYALDAYRYSEIYLNSFVFKLKYIWTDIFPKSYTNSLIQSTNWASFRLNQLGYQSSLIFDILDSKQQKIMHKPCCKILMDINLC